MVTLRAPDPGEATTRFFDIPGLRAATELVLGTPHPGFFSTPAFFANWPTNQSNQMRVTANQALIVATGTQVDGTEPYTLPLAAALDAGLDEEHAQPGTACFGCHQILDPTRAILSSAWTYSYYQQLDPARMAQKGLFAFESTPQTVSTVADFGGELAAHPAFPTAWVQKLCYYANSAPCLTTDPEFQRIVALFVSTRYAWDPLVAELFSSPLVTNATPTLDHGGRRGGLGVASRPPLRGARFPARAHRRVRPLGPHRAVRDHRDRRRPPLGRLRPGRDHPRPAQRAPRSSSVPEWRTSARASPSW